MAAKKPNDAARGAEHGPRHYSRALALQGLYGWVVAGGDAGAIGSRLLTPEQMGRVDVEFFRTLLAGAIGAADDLRAGFAGLVDRPLAQLSPVEHAVLLLGAYELQQVPEVPYRVVINEAIELAKSYGGTDGFRFVNGVLDRLAQRLRPAEAAPVVRDGGPQPA
jgi:transcription antitermination protein NusB